MGEIGNNIYIHPTAVVEEGGTVGEGTKIWHFSHIMSGSTIGKQCVIGQNCFVATKVKIGNGVKIQNNVSLYEGVKCEDEVFIGPSVVFTNVINPRAAIVRRDEFKTTLVGRGATIGANSTIVCGVKIGAFAFVSAGAVVTEDVPDYTLVMGVPARASSYRSSSGMKLEFNSKGEAAVEGEHAKYHIDSSRKLMKT